MLRDFPTLIDCPTCHPRGPQPNSMRTSHKGKQHEKHNPSQQPKEASGSTRSRVGDISGDVPHFARGTSGDVPYLARSISGDVPYLARSISGDVPYLVGRAPHLVGDIPGPLDWRNRIAQPAPFASRLGLDGFKTAEFALSGAGYWPGACGGG